MGYPGRDPGMVTRMDSAHWECGLNDVDVEYPDIKEASRTVAWLVAGERRYDETTISKLKKPHRNYMRFWPFWVP